MTPRRHLPVRDEGTGGPSNRSAGRSVPKLLLEMFGLGILLVVASAADPKGALSDSGFEVVTGVLIFVPVGIGLLWVCFAMLRAGRQIGRQIGEGLNAHEQPLPTPQIEQTLAQHLGRQPTLQEIADVQHILARDRQAKINDGIIGAAGLAVMHLIGRGKL